MPVRTPPAGLPLADAAELTRTGDLWLFRGHSPADRAIQSLTNAPVNHVGMAVVLDDLPPLMWHAELGRGLVDAWTGTRHRGVQLHDLRDAVDQWRVRYGQRAWLRQLHVPGEDDGGAPGSRGGLDRAAEDALLQEVARKDGTPFPATAALVGRWARGRVAARSGRSSSRRTDGRTERRAAETLYCAEVVASAYQAMGLLPAHRPVSSFDPGTFWSGDHLELLGGALLGEEISVL